MSTENNEDGWPPSGKARRPSGGDSFETPWSKMKSRRGGGGGDSGPPTVVKVIVGVTVALVVGVVGLGVTGRLGVTSVEANEVAVRVNYLTGVETVITTPGYQFFIPFLADIYKFDGTTQEYVMAGNSYRGTNVAAQPHRAGEGRLQLLVRRAEDPVRADPGRRPPRSCGTPGSGTTTRRSGSRPTRARSCGTSSASTAPLTPADPHDLQGRSRAGLVSA